MFIVPLLAAFLTLTPLDEAGFQKLVQANKGKVVLYDFWATWCAACRAEMPALIKLDKKLHSSGFVLVTISADEPEQAAGAAKMADQAGMPKPVYRKDPKNDEAFINSIDREWSGALPAMFLYDKNGRKVRSFIGETDTATIEKAIRALQ
jgi:thiol-disulfide isomerase/thioredoxin